MWLLLLSLVAVFAFISYAEASAPTGSRPNQGELGYFTNDLLYDMGSLRDCIMFHAEEAAPQVNAEQQDAFNCLLRSMQEANETPYWLVNLEDCEPRELAKDGSVLYCFGEALYSWSGIMLLQNKQYLKGIWKLISEDVEKNLLSTRFLPIWHFCLFWKLLAC